MESNSSTDVFGLRLEFGGTVHHHWTDSLPEQFSPLSRPRRKSKRNAGANRRREGNRRRTAPRSTTAHPIPYHLTAPEIVQPPQQAASSPSTRTVASRFSDSWIWPTSATPPRCSGGSATTAGTRRCRCSRTGSWSCTSEDGCRRWCAFLYSCAATGSAANMSAFM
jgi:hypothetical protein